MKRSLAFSSIVACISWGIFGVAPGYSQNAPTNSMRVTIDRPFTRSAETFKEVWDGVVNVGVSYQRLIRDECSLGSSFEYSYFQMDKSKFGGTTKLHILSPAISLVYRLKMMSYSSRSQAQDYLSSSLDLGYSWLRFTNKDFPDEAEQFNEAGIFLSPKISYSYRITHSVSIELQVSYKVIFEHFGDDSLKEDSTIRFVTIGTGISWGN